MEEPWRSGRRMAMGGGERGWVTWQETWGRWTDPCPDPCLSCCCCSSLLSPSGSCLPGPWSADQTARHPGSWQVLARSYLARTLPGAESSSRPSSLPLPAPPCHWQWRQLGSRGCLWQQQSPQQQRCQHLASSPCQWPTVQGWTCTCWLPGCSACVARATEVLPLPLPLLPLLSLLPLLPLLLPPLWSHPPAMGGPARAWP